MARSVTITGTRSVDETRRSGLRSLFRSYLQPFVNPETGFYVGGAVGIDTLVLDWLAEHTQAVLTVVVPCLVSDQPEPAIETIARWDSRGRLGDIVELGAPKLSTNAYHARNRWMVDRSDFVIGFPSGAEPSTGTWYTLNYATEQNKPRLVVPV